MDTFSIVPLSEAHWQTHQDYICALGDEERYPFVLDYDADDFPAYLQRVKKLESGVGVPPGGAPSTTFWLFRHKELIGVSNLRHTLTPELALAGGHIELSIKPGFRRTGAGEYLLRQSLIEAASKGIDIAHIHCYEENKACSALIRRCNGVLHSTIGYGGKTVSRYQIRCPA